MKVSERAQRRGEIEREKQSEKEKEKARIQRND